MSSFHVALRILTRPLNDSIASPVTENRETVSDSAASVTIQVRRNSFPTTVSHDL